MGDCSVRANKLVNANSAILKHLNSIACLLAVICMFYLSLMGIQIKCFIGYEYQKRETRIAKGYNKRFCVVTVPLCVGLTHGTENHDRL